MARAAQTKKKRPASQAKLGRRIGIDARFFGMGSAGLARYTQELIRHLAAADSPHTFVVFLRSEDLVEFDLHAPNIEVRTTDIAHYTFDEQVLLNRQLKAANLDLMHFTNFNFPLSYRGRFVISINDLTLLRYAGRSPLSRFKTRPMKLVMAAGARRGRQILTYSEYQKRLIVDTFGVDPDKIHVAYLAVDRQFKPASARAVTAFRKRHQLTKPFIMYTGQWREHKNLVRLIRAFRLVRDQIDSKLVLVGKIDPAFPIIPQTIAKHGLVDDVVLTSFVSDDELPMYYNAADIFAFPSLSEGFGLPPLEAMACGTTVAASQAPPMPEVLGRAAAFFDPRSDEDVAAVLIDLLRHPRKRSALRTKGFAQVKRYSWKQTAAETLAAYERALRD